MLSFYMLLLCVMCVHKCIYVNCLYVSLCVLRVEGNLGKALPLLRSQNAVYLIVHREHAHGCADGHSILRERDFC